MNRYPMPEIKDVPDDIRARILEVQDNGRGLTGRELSGAKSLGLLGMRERATMLDGEVNIIGRQGKGTTVGVRIPIHRPEELPKK